MTSNNVGGHRRMWLALILGIAAILAVAGALAGLKVMAASASPEKLSDEELLSKVARAPEKAPDFSATLSVEQSVIPAQLLEAAGQDGKPDAAIRSGHHAVGADLPEGRRGRV